MPSGTYYRAQAELFARLAMVSRDPWIAEQYRQKAVEHMRKAERAAPDTGGLQSDVAPRARDDGGRGKLDP